MPKLPRLTARQIVAVLEKLGFSLARQSGSHMIYKNAAGKRATVPFHSAKILHPKILKSILRDADLSMEKLTELLKWDLLIRTKPPLACLLFLEIEYALPKQTEIDGPVASLAYNRLSMALERSS